MTDEVNITHVYHHQDHAIRVSVKAECNTKGWNYEASVADAISPDEALEVLKRTTDSLARVYSTPALAQPQG